MVVASSVVSASAIHCLKKNENALVFVMTSNMSTATLNSTYALTTVITVCQLAVKVTVWFLRRAQ